MMNLEDLISIKVFTSKSKKKKRNKTVYLVKMAVLGVFSKIKVLIGLDNILAAC